VDADVIKQALRQRALAARAAVPDRAAREAAIQGAIAKLVAQRFPGESVAAYMPMRGEVDPIPGLADHAGALALPVVVAAGQPLIFRRWASGEALEVGIFGTRHPSASAAEITPSLVLVPLAGFDRSGHRLGYGGGFYDRTLAKLRAAGPVFAAGIAFSVQQVEMIPVEATDAPLDAIITEDGLRGFPLD